MRWWIGRGGGEEWVVERVEAGRGFIVTACVSELVAIVLL